MADNQLRNAFADAIHSELYKDWKRMLTGRRVDATTVTMSDAPPGKVWVRGHDQSREQTAVWGSASRPNAGVVVGPGFDGADEIKTLDWEQATATHGDAARYLLVPIGGDETVPRSIPGMGFVPGRVEPSELGGLYVHVRSFRYDGGYWDDGGIDGDPTFYDFDLSAYVPSTSGHVGWVAVYLDPADNTLHAQAGTTVPFSGVEHLSETALTNIALPYGVYPLGAVALANGQTAIDDSSRLTDMRQHLDGKGVANSDWNRIVVDADGSVVTDADGFVVVDYGT